MEKEQLYEAFCPKCGGCGGVIALGYIAVNWHAEFWTKEGLPTDGEEEEQLDAYLWEEDPYYCRICDSYFDKPILVEVETKNENVE